MKKFFAFLIILLIGAALYYKFMYIEGEFKKIVNNTEEESFIVDRYTVFGQYLNISGCINKVLSEDSIIVLKNLKEEIKLEGTFETGDNTCFRLSDINNGGIYLDGLSQGRYILLIRENDNGIIKYYNLKNNTNYNNLKYYTITKEDANNEIKLDFLKYNQKEYFNVNVSRSKLPGDVYDITIDPGHGGKDIGTSFKLNNQVYNESDITLKISLKLKKELESYGLKVKITRDDDVSLDNYGTDGRATIPNSSKSKYSISIHINSSDGNMNYGGVEVYTPNDINYDLAKGIADNIANIVGYSKKKNGLVLDGVYYTYFNESDIEASAQEMIDKGLKPYEIEVGAPYMFMIREVGGISTHAYVDGRNEIYGENEYYNSNQAAEPYLLELGYINYKDDLYKLSNNSDEFSSAIASAIKEYW